MIKISTIENNLAVAKSYHSSKTESSKLLKINALEKVLNELIDFVENGSLIKIIFNFRTIINLIKEVVNMLKTALR